jgi:hypothetical protein
MVQEEAESTFLSFVEIWCWQPLNQGAFMAAMLLEGVVIYEAVLLRDWPFT